MENNVAKTPGLQLRGKTYFLRMRVPTDLVNAYGQKEVNRTLKTRNYDEARVRCIQERLAVESEFDALRKQLKAANENPDLLSSYSDYELERIAIRWFRENEKNKQKPDNNVYSQEQLKDAPINLEVDLQAYTDEVNGAETHSEHRGLSKASDYLKSIGITFDHKSENFQKMGRLMSRALAESTRQDVRFWKGKPYSPTDKMFIESTNQPEHGNAALPKKTVSELCEEYINDPSANRNSGTLKNYKIVLRVLGEVIGKSRQIREITREDCKNKKAKYSKL